MSKPMVNVKPNWDHTSGVLMIAAQRLASAARRRAGTAHPKLERIIAHPDAQNAPDSGESAARGVRPQE
jgi:hypothetical protein